MTVEGGISRSAQRLGYETYSAHPLDTTFSDDTCMTRRVLVFASTLSNVGDGSLAAMWVVGETLHSRECIYVIVVISNADVRRTAPLPMWKWSSMRKGVRFRSCWEPMERRTSAPAPYTHLSQYDVGEKKMDSKAPLRSLVREPSLSRFEILKPSQLVVERRSES